MKNLKTVIAFGVVLGVVAGSAGGVAAQDKTAIVKERQDTMKRQGGDLKYIADFAKGLSGDQVTAI